jgi:site-specific recombinase XerD
MQSRQEAGLLSSAEHVDNAKRALEQFASSFGDIGPTLIKKHDFLRWLYRNKSWRSSNTRKRVVDTVRSCFNWAVKENLIPFSPLQTLRLRPASRPRATMKEHEYVLLMRPMQKAIAPHPLFLAVHGRSAN